MHCFDLLWVVLIGGPTWRVSFFHYPATEQITVRSLKLFH